MIYFFAFAAAAVFSAVATPVVRRIALGLHIVDDPAAAPERKIHAAPMPLLGGVAVACAFFVVTTLFLLRGDVFTGAEGSLPQKYFWTLLCGALVLLVGGFLDDKKNLRARWKFLYPVLAAVIVVAGGIGIIFVTNPFGGVLQLDQIRIQVFSWGGIPYHLILFADVFTFLWLMGSMFTTKFLDGLDGLVSGVSIIGSVVIFLLSIRPDVAQPETALLAVILAGSFAGFLPYNFFPARIFLGEFGSLFAGFILGVLAVISGGKIATALLILGLPILDVAWSILRRVRAGRSPATADQKHLHHRLLDAGLSHKNAVLVLYILTAVFGFSTLFVQGAAKAVVLLALLCIMIFLAWLADYFERRAARTRHE